VSSQSDERERIGPAEDGVSEGSNKNDQPSDFRACRLECHRVCDRLTNTATQGDRSRWRGTPPEPHLFDAKQHKRDVRTWDGRTSATRSEK